MTKRLLILGSGFSKAAFPNNMPTVTELADHLRQQEFFQKAPYDRLVGDPELLLSYLSSEQPWKQPEEVLRDKALFVQVQKSLTEFIAVCEDQAFKNSLPDWAKQWVEYLHQSRIPVITFNYDTVLERVAFKLCEEKKESGEAWPEAYNLIYSLYNLPLAVIELRYAGPLGGEEVETFQLMKLHGSINWFYSGVEGFPGEQVYWRPVDSDSPLTDRLPKITSVYETNSKHRLGRLLKDRIPLIIPPLAEKSRFYSNQTLRSLWWDARKALADADEIFCVGYSLPPTQEFTHNSSHPFLSAFQLLPGHLIVQKPDQPS